MFDEHCSYGFRRNLWGLKGVGVALGIVGVAVTLGLLVAHGTLGIEVDVPRVVAATVLSAALLLCWSFWITESWVRIPAEAYAERLLAVGIEAGGRDSNPPA